MKCLVVLLVLLMTATFVTAQTRGGTQAPFVNQPYVSHDQVTATLSKPTGGAFFYRDPNWRVAVNRRGAGKPETHAQTAHVWIILEGEATVVTGGKIVGDSVEGGQAYHLTKGDMLTIPAGTPHWVKECPTQTIAFWVMNLGIGPP